MSCCWCNVNIMWVQTIYLKGWDILPADGRTCTEQIQSTSCQPSLDMRPWNGFTPHDRIHFQTAASCSGVSLTLPVHRPTSFIWHKQQLKNYFPPKSMQGSVLKWLALRRHQNSMIRLVHSGSFSPVRTKQGNRLSSTAETSTKSTDRTCLLGQVHGCSNIFLKQQFPWGIQT